MMIAEHGHERFLNCSPQDILLQSVFSLLTIEARCFRSLILSLFWKDRSVDLMIHIVLVRRVCGQSNKASLVDRIWLIIHRLFG